MMRNAGIARNFMRHSSAPYRAEKGAIRTLKINLKGYEWTNADATDGILCKFVSIKHTGRKAAASTQARPKDYIPIIRTVARCIGEGVDEVWRERQEFTYYKGSLAIKQLK